MAISSIEAIESLSREEFRALRSEISQLTAFHEIVAADLAASNLAMTEVHDFLLRHGIPEEVLKSSESIADAVWAIKARSVTLS